jgi:thioredoxin 1
MFMVVFVFYLEQRTPREAGTDYVEIDNERNCIVAKPVAVTDGDFEQKVLKSDVPVVVDFWAPWCGPCRAIADTLEKLAGDYDGRLTVAKVNTDENVRWAGQLGVQSIPTLIFFKNGQEVNRLIGSRPENAYRQEFDKIIG